MILDNEEREALLEDYIHNLWSQFILNGFMTKDELLQVIEERLRKS